MDNYDLKDEERELAAMVREFAEEVVAPRSYEADRTHTLPLDLVAQMGDLGLFGLPFPEEVGGQGGDLFALGLAIEGIGRVDQSLAITLEAGVSLGAMPIYRFGTQAQKDELLPDLLTAKALAGFGLTEPDAGSDAGATRTKARLDGGEWVINGSKQFITNSGTAITKFVTVTAVTGEKDGRKEISTIIVPNGTPGFTVEPAYDKLGWNASDTHPLTFVDARVPEANLLGRTRPRVRQLPAHSRRGPHRDRRAVDRCGGGLPRGGDRVRAVAHSLRRGALDAPERAVHHRPDAASRAQRAARLAPRGPSARRGQGLQDRSGDGENHRIGRRDGQCS